MLRLVRLAVLGLALSAAGVSARAQSAAVPPPPYESQLLRLSEIIGALHYLRTICPGPDTGQWRREMQAFLDVEAQAPERREQLTLSFNRGYHGFERSHRTCTAAAQLAVRRYVDEGRRIIADVTSRFVN